MQKFRKMRFLKVTKRQKYSLWEDAQKDMHREKLHSILHIVCENCTFLLTNAKVTAV